MKLVLILSTLGVVLTLVIVLPVVLILPHNEETSNDVLVKVEEGHVVGRRLDGSAIFWGIPFSQPPTGEYRWRKPRNPLPYVAKYWNATYARPACPQICDQPAAEYSCPHATDEDCLYLNVWIPDALLTKSDSRSVLDNTHHVVSPEYLPQGTKNPLPVMVWFYGGNFLNGAGTCTLYDGRFMAPTGDVIVVTTNYRVAHLGFLVQGTESTGDGKGNFGWWDQVKTLEWVNKNIRQFGGDPSRVTLFGQSAGAESIAVHLTSPYSTHLFHQAIMQSNPFGLPFRNLTDAKEFGGRFALAANCPRDDMDCLRSKTLSQLEKAFNETTLEITDPQKITLVFQPWSPVVDWDVVPDIPINLFIKGEVQNKPIMLGATADEGMIFIAEAFPQPLSGLQYKAILLAVFKQDHYIPIIEKYPAVCEEEENCDNRNILDKLATEALFVCPQRKAFQSLSHSNSWWYIFNQTWSFPELWEEPLCYERVCHAAELAYMFNIENLTTLSYTSNEEIFANRLIWYWANFAKYGDPNGLQSHEMQKFKSSKVIVDGKHWPRFGIVDQPNHYKAIHLTANGDSVLEDAYSDICDFWDSLEAYAEHY